MISDGAKAISLQDDSPFRGQAKNEFGFLMVSAVHRQRIISRLETVADFPTVPILLELCRVLRVSSDELLGLKAPPRVETPRQPPEEKRLWRHLRVVAQLPERDQRAVLRLIDTAARATKAG